MGYHEVLCRLHDLKARVEFGPITASITRRSPLGRALIATGVQLRLTPYAIELPYRTERDQAGEVWEAVVRAAEVVARAGR